MTYRGALTAILMAGIMGSISYFFNPAIALIILGIFYLFLGFVHMTNRLMYDKIITMINVDKWNAYQKKDDEFKSYIKDNALSMIFIGIVLLYFAYRWFGKAFKISYSILIMIMVLGSYLIDTYAMTKSKNWEDYKKKSLMWMIILVAIAIFILRL